MNTLIEIYNYREMIFSLVRRDLKGRYKGSVLGFAWTFLNPLLQLTVYTMVFSIIMRAGIEDYYLFLFVALVPWIFFASSVSGGAGCIKNQAELVKKIYFPREVLPIAYVTSQFVNMLLSFIVVIGVLFLAGKSISLSAWLSLPLVMLVEYLLAIAFAMLTSAITVYVRDVEYFLGIVVMAWQFLSPVMYGLEQVPEKIRPFFQLNPMTPVITAYRDILYYGKAPELATLMQAIIFGIVILLLGWISFDNLKRHFAEEM